MKRTSLSVAIASLCSGGAYALDDPTTADFDVVIGGATAIQTSTFNAVIDNLCTADIDAFEDDDHWIVACEVDGAFGSPGATATFRKNNGGSGQGATSVELGVGVEVLRRDAACAPAATFNQSTPKGTAFEAWDCANDRESVAPDWGVSDVEPKMFRGALSILVGGVPTPLPVGAALDSRATASLPFGMVGTLSLVQALQNNQFPLGDDCNPEPINGAADNGSVLGSTAGDGINDAYQAYATDSTQPVLFDGGTGLHIPETPDSKGYSDQPHRVGDTRACMPTISLTEARSMLRGEFGNWSEFKLAGGTDLVASAAGKPWAPTAPNFTLCRRIQGSGTHATISSQILGTECSKSESVMIEPDSSFGSQFPRLVFGNQGSSNLGECLDDVETDSNNEVGDDLDLFGITRLWAVGYQSVEKNPDLEEAYRFIKIDGQSPDMKNFVEGDYWIFGATTVNRNDDDSNGAGEYVNPVGFFPTVDNMFERLVDELSDPSNLLDLNAGLGHPFGWSGFTGTKSAGVNVLPSFPFDPDPTAAVPDNPIQSLTHVDPLVGTPDMCFGPVLRSVGGATASVADEENAE